MEANELKDLNEGIKSIFDKFNVLDSQVTIGGLRNDILNLVNNVAVPKQSKFKVGDWVRYYDWNVHIIGVKSDRYIIEGDPGDYILKSYAEKARLWTINDAIEGDVLVSPAISAGEKDAPFIFKGIDKNGVVRYHAVLQNEGLKISNGVTNVMGYAVAGYHIPATESQKNLLYAKMKESGYTWDKALNSVVSLWTSVTGDNTNSYITKEDLVSAVDLLEMEVVPMMSKSLNTFDCKTLELVIGMFKRLLNYNKV